MSRNELIEEALTRSVLGAFFEVYNGLGFGFLEKMYVRALEHELRNRGHRLSREFCVRVMYRGVELGQQRLDLVVDDKLVLEVKSTQDLPKADIRQVYNYLRATSFEVGLLLHFGPEPKFYRVFFDNALKERRG